MKLIEQNAEAPMKIVFATPDEPSVIPIFFGKVIPELRGEIAAIAVVSPIYKRSSWMSQAKRFIDAFGVREFIVEALQFAYQKARGRRSVKAIARQHGLRLLTPESVNAPDFLGQLREIDPDLVISVSCPQIFGRELLGVPRHGCINVHSALLPHYRGMLPTFWVLAEGEERTGVTVHYMSPGIDGGDILGQTSISIAREETLRSLMRKCKTAAADLVLETVRRFRAGEVRTLPNPPDEGSYFSFPTRDDVMRFKARGRTLR
jgi:methionyl-tRNA formyltransferase